ncbi:MAG: hypothetical protein OXI53_05710 [Nitrospira sp.]|nr:hypothetical protein [Nitrospira sp.]MDE0404789.1 hypothetical protein [Nitrospira sp.]
MRDRIHRVTTVGVALVLILGGLAGCESVSPDAENMGGTRRAEPI